MTIIKHLDRLSTASTNKEKAIAKLFILEASQVPVFAWVHGSQDAAWRAHLIMDACAAKKITTWQAYCRLRSLAGKHHRKLRR